MKKSTVTGEEVNERVLLILKAFQVAALKIPVDYTTDIALLVIALGSMERNEVPRHQLRRLYAN